MFSGLLWVFVCFLALGRGLLAAGLAAGTEQNRRYPEKGVGYEPLGPNPKP